MHQFLLDSPNFEAFLTLLNKKSFELRKHPTMIFYFHLSQRKTHRRKQSDLQHIMQCFGSERTMASITYQYACHCHALRYTHALFLTLVYRLKDHASITVTKKSNIRNASFAKIFSINLNIHITMN